MFASEGGTVSQMGDRVMRIVLQLVLDCVNDSARLGQKFRAPVLSDMASLG